MRAANLNAGGNRLDQTMRILRTKWLTVRESWKDELSETFDADHIAPLERQMQSTVRAIEKLGDLCVKIERDCQ